MPVSRIGGRRIRETVNLLAERDGPRCHLCGQAILMELSGNHGDGPTLDHQKAIADDGTNDLDNLRLAHSRCNKRRGRRPPDDLGATSRKWLP